MLNNIFTDSLKEQARRFQDPVQHMAQAMVSSNAATTRNKVAPTPQIIALHWAMGTNSNIPPAR